MCTVIAGDQPLEIMWLKDGEPLTDRSRTQKLDDFTVILSLRRLQLEDMGNYTCQVSNSAGVVSYTSSLKVKGTFDDGFRSRRLYASWASLVDWGRQLHRLRSFLFLITNLCAFPSLPVPNTFCFCYGLVYISHTKKQALIFVSFFVFEIFCVCMKNKHDDGLWFLQEDPIIDKPASLHEFLLEKRK